MSELSLLTGVYANVEVFAALIDTVIERAAKNPADASNPDQRRLGQLLVDAGDQGRAAGSYEALILDSLLRDAKGESLLDLRRLGRRLLEGPADSSDKRQLEVLAKGLERERSEVAGRLRGRR
jgi:hypothetical protein